MAGRYVTLQAVSLAAPAPLRLGGVVVRVAGPQCDPTRPARQLCGTTPLPAYSETQFGQNDRNGSCDALATTAAPASP